MRYDIIVIVSFCRNLGSLFFTLFYVEHASRVLVHSFPAVLFLGNVSTNATRTLH